MKMLTDYCFRMQMNPGYKNDLWALSGRIMGHPRFQNGQNVFVSRPKSLNRKDRTITTHSGSVYQLESPRGNEEEIFREIENVIHRGGYSTH